MTTEAIVREAVDNAIGEIIQLVKATGDNGYLRRTDLEHMLKEIRRNLKTDPSLYRRLVLKPIGAGRPRGAGPDSIFRAP